MSFYMLSPENDSTLDKETLIQHTPFSYFNHSDIPYYQSDCPFSLIFTTLCTETTAPLRVATVSPDFSFHSILDSTEFQQIASTRTIHQHNTFELLFVIDGEFYQRVELTRHKYIPGSCCLLNPNVRHMEEYSSDCRLVTLSLSRSFLQHLFSREQEYYFKMEREKKETSLEKFLFHNFRTDTHTEKNYIDFIPQKDNTWVRENMHRLFDLLTQQIIGPEIGTTHMVKALIYKIFHFLDTEENYHTTPILLGSEAESTLFSKITDCMLTSHGRMSRHELETVLNYSGTYINDIVKKFTGMNIFQYGTEFTMKEAAQLLSSTNLSVSEIASRLSFSDRTHFYKLFHTAYGMTPKEYRKCNH